MYFQKSKKKRQRSVSVHLPKEGAGGGNFVRGKYLRCFLVVTLLLASFRSFHLQSCAKSFSSSKKEKSMGEPVLGRDETTGCCCTRSEQTS